MPRGSRCTSEDGAVLLDGDTCTKDNGTAGILVNISIPSFIDEVESSFGAFFFFLFLVTLASCSRNAILPSSFFRLPRRNFLSSGSSSSSVVFSITSRATKTKKNWGKILMTQPNNKRGEEAILEEDEGSINGNIGRRFRFHSGTLG